MAHKNTILCRSFFDDSQLISTLAQSAGAAEYISVERQDFSTSVLFMTLNNPIVRLQ